jgi:saccharopine dehydrogenase-like NADP-dependent oxidoreductase
MKIAVLGAGMVGRAMSLDLANEYDVTSFDISKDNLTELNRRNTKVKTVSADLSSYKEYKNWLVEFDLVVNAVPGHMGFAALEAIINSGKSVADISFFPEDALKLDKLAKEKNVTAITDCGVAPGVSNYIIGRYNEEMKIENFECYVGGLPVERKKPFEYKAPFSPIDVIEEYIRPARMMEDGKIITKEPLSDRELMEFNEVGTLEAFNTDGLRSLLYTMSHVPDMKEKTLRYPGHIDLIIALKEAGFFDTDPIRINDTDISPLEFVSKILINQWQLDPEEEEFTIMKVLLQGKANGKSKTVEYNLLDRYDRKTKTSSMARTTGYTCTATANLIAKGLFTEKGVFPPELVGKNKKCFDFVMNYLFERGVIWKNG